MSLGQNLSASHRTEGRIPMAAEKNPSPTGHRILVPPSMIPFTPEQAHRAASVSFRQPSSSSQAQCPGQHPNISSKTVWKGMAVLVHM